MGRAAASPLSSVLERRSRQLKVKTPEVGSIAAPLFCGSSENSGVEWGREAAEGRRVETVGRAATWSEPFCIFSADTHFVTLARILIFVTFLICKLSNNK